MRLSLVLVVGVMLLLQATRIECKPLAVVTHPVLLIPGLSASQIEARLNKTSSPHFICSRHSDWFRIWMSPSEFFPKVLDCFIDNFRLVFNPETGLTENPPGVETRVPGFGQTQEIEVLSSMRMGPGEWSALRFRLKQSPRDSLALCISCSASRQPTTTSTWLKHSSRSATFAGRVCEELPSTSGAPCVSAFTH